jgi:hypothetical protein
MSDMSSSSNELSQPFEPKKLKRSSIGDSDEISIIEDPALLGHSVKEEKTKSKEEDLGNVYSIRSLTLVPLFLNESL